MKPATWVAALLAALSAGCEVGVDVLEEGTSGMEAGAEGPEPDAAPPPTGDVTDIVAAYEDSCAVRGGALYCWGTAPDGRFTATPQRVEGGGAGNWISVSGGNRAHCAKQASGSVWCWGHNEEGQLGQGDRTQRAEPTPVSLPRAAISVRGHFRSFCAVLEDGSLTCWGDNKEGALGQGDPFPGDGVDGLLPLPVGPDAKWSDAVVGDGHTCAITNGELYCWGRNGAGELGQGPPPGQTRAPVRTGDANDWSAIVAGQNFTCGIRRPGALYCWGDGDSGELGLGDTLPRDVPTRVGDADDWTSVAIDTFHTCGIRRPGELYCWGRNDEGQLALGGIENRTVPTRVGGDSDWVQVAVGRFHTCARRANGLAYCAGENTNGRLGTGDEDYGRKNTMTLVHF